MKIGVFGDSFADKASTRIWWRYLSSVHGHDVECYGEAGSSLGFSVECMENHAQRYDLIIWSVTSVNRISIWHRDKIYHNTGTWQRPPTGDQELDRKLLVIHHYLAEAFDFHFQEILGHALVHSMLQKYPNLMIIPSFATPIYFMQTHQFNLFDLCQKETGAVFPGEDIGKVVNSERDQRQGHLTDVNQQILAKLIDRDLRPGIFCTDYNNFCFDPHMLQKDFGLINS